MAIGGKREGAGRKTGYRKPNPKKVLNVRIDPELKDWLLNYSEKKKKKQVDIVEAALNLYKDQMEK
jgi:hypothetical protein